MKKSNENAVGFKAVRLLTVPERFSSWNFNKTFTSIKVIQERFCAELIVNVNKST